MNHSMYGADRATHLKIVVIALVCALVVAAIGIFAHVSSNIDLGTAALVKAGRPTSLSGNIPHPIARHGAIGPSLLTPMIPALRRSFGL